MKGVPMGLHYSLDVYLANLNELYLPVYIGWIIAMICFYIYYMACILRARRDKRCGMPWQANMWNFANDFVYVVSFSSWWNPSSPTHHWVTMFLWVGLVIWFIMEFIVHYQTIKYDLTTEMFPHAKSKSTALLMYWGVQVCFVAGYWFIWSMMDDPLVHIMFLTTFTGCLIFNFQMMSKRGSTRGIAPVVPWVLLIAQVAGYFIILPSADPVMANFYTYFMGTCATALGIAFVYMYKKLPRYKPSDV